MDKKYPEDAGVLARPIIRDVITPGSEADIEAIKKKDILFSREFIGEGIQESVLKYFRLL